MKFIIDNQLPRALVRWLAAKGHAARHARDLGPTSVSDTQIWRTASGEGAVILTCDKDFSHPRLTNLPRPAVVLLGFGNARKPELFSRLEEVWPELVAQLEAGEVLIQLR